jgi:hypothetical protein
MMRVYTVEGPDGRRYKIEGPEGATAEQLSQVILGQQQQAPDPTEGMSTAQKVLAGIGKGMVDFGRGAGQFIPKGLPGHVSREDVAKARELDAPLMNTTSGKVGNVIGAVSTALPAAFIPGANTLAGSTAIGAMYGLLQPSEGTGETLTNVGVGGVGGALVPGAAKAIKVGKSFIEPLYGKGREQIIGRTIANAAGGQIDDALRNIDSAVDLVPGSQLTTAQAAKVPSLAALERTAAAIDPSTGNAYAARLQAQGDARLAALQKVTPDKQAAVAARKQVSDRLYDQARTINIDPATINPQVQSQINGLMQKLPDDVVARAKELAKLNGVQLDDAGSVQGLHWIKKGIDSKISTAARAGDNEMVSAYKSLQNEFLDTLDQLSPAYQQARKAYAGMSPPVNQAELLEAIAARGKDFRGDLTPAAFSRALTDKVAKTTTGNPSATLAKTLSPDQLKVVNAIKQDLMLADYAKTAGRGVGSDTVQKMAYSNILNQSGVPTFVRDFGPTGVVGNVMQRAGQVVYKDANEQMARELAEALMDPKRAAELIRKGVVTPQQLARLNAINRSGAVAGASAPGLLYLDQ